MATYIVQQNQNIMDVAMQVTGRLDNVMAICAANDIGITDALVPGEELVIPDGLVVDTVVLEGLLLRGVVIGTENG